MIHYLHDQLKCRNIKLVQVQNAVRVTQSKTFFKLYFSNTGTTGELGQALAHLQKLFSFLINT